LPEQWAPEPSPTDIGQRSEPGGSTAYATVGALQYMKEAIMKEAIMKEAIMQIEKQKKKGVVYQSA
jgi:hypothetical protein